MELKDKRYQLTLGIHIAPNNAPLLYAGPHHYGKLRYEDMVQVQAIAAKYARQFEEAMEPLVRELMDLGFADADKIER